MKNFFVTMVMLAAALTATAQTAKPTEGLKGYVTNGFWANWEVGAGVGLNYYHYGTETSSRIGWEFNAAATKWVIPAVGLRVQAQVGQHKYHLNGDQSQTYIGLHGDLMVNVSNWVRYREDRLYYAVPFVGFGLLTTDPTDGAENYLGAYAGVLNKFRVNDHLDVNLELKAYTAKMSGFQKMMSVTAGVSYRFNKRGWDVAPKPVDVSGYVKQIKALENDLAVANQATSVAKSEAARAVKEAEAAKHALANVKPVTVEGSTKVVSAVMVFFPIGKSTLTNQDKMRLDHYADQIKKGDANKVYAIEAYCDSATGTAAVNQRLSEARAKAVHDYLVSKGIKAEQLNIKAYGATKSPFGNAAYDRVVIVSAE